jgi:hypothetical protein
MTLIYMNRKILIILFIFVNSFLSFTQETVQISIERIDDIIYFTINRNGNEFHFTADILGPVCDYSLSQNSQYLAIDVGTDIIGSIYFFNTLTGELIHSDSYHRDPLTWNNNNLEYSSIIYTTSLCSIVEKVIFSNGEIIYTNKQSIDSYHVTGPSGVFSDSYNEELFITEINRFGYNQISDKILEILFLTDFNYDIIDKLKTEPLYKLSDKEYSELINICTYTGEYLININKRKDAIRLFDIFYPFLSYNSRNIPYRIEEKDLFLNEYFKIVDLDINLINN